MITKFKQVVMELIKNEDGQDLIEYALVAGLVGVGAVASLSSLDTKLKTLFNSVGSELTNAT